MTRRPQTEQGTKLQSMTHHSDTQPGINTQAGSLDAGSPGAVGADLDRFRGDLRHTHTDSHTHTHACWWSSGPPRTEIMRGFGRSSWTEERGGSGWRLDWRIWPRSDRVSGVQEYPDCVYTYIWDRAKFTPGSTVSLDCVPGWTHWNFLPSKHLKLK